MKRFLSFLSLLTAVVFLFPCNSLAAEATTQTQAHSQVLLVCDENNGRSRLEELIRATGKSVDSVSESAYQTSDLSDYSYLVTTANEPYRDAVNAGIPTVCVGENAGPVDGIVTANMENVQLTFRLDDHMQDVFVQSALVAEDPSGLTDTYGRIEMVNGLSFPFAAVGPNAAYVPWYEEAGLSSVMLGGFLEEYFDGRSSADGQMYILIDEVYAFSDLDMLRRTADVFHDNGISFIVRVMPLYDNLDYPAFQRFTQALLYVQSKGGSIVLHDPIVREYESVREALETRMERAKTAFADADITLLDMSLPPLGITMDDIHNIKRTTINFGEFPINTMIGYHLFETEDELVQEVKEINAAWLTLSNYKAKFSIGNSIYIEKEIDADYIFRKAEETSLKEFFTGANQVLLIIVGTCVIVFGLLIIVGHRIYLRKFYKK